MNVSDLGFFLSDFDEVGHYAAGWVNTPAPATVIVRQHGVEVGRAVAAKPSDHPGRGTGWLFGIRLPGNDEGLSVSLADGRPLPCAWS